MYSVGLPVDVSVGSCPNLINVGKPSPLWVAPFPWQGGMVWLMTMQLLLGNELGLVYVPELERWFASETIQSRGRGGEGFRKRKTENREGSI